MIKTIAIPQMGNLKNVWNKLVFLLASGHQGIRDVLISGIPQIATMATGLIVSIVIARALGPSSMGQYALVMSVAGMVMSLSDLGIGQTAIRYASLALGSRDADAHFAVLRWAFRLRMTLVFLIVLFVYCMAPAIAINIWHQPMLTSYIRISLFICIFTAIAAIPRVYFQSIKYFGMNSLVQVAQALITLTGILVLASWSHWTLENLIGVMIISAALGAGIMLLMVPRAAVIARPPNICKAGFLEGLKAIWRNPVNETLDETGCQVERPSTFAFYMFVSSLIIVISQQMDIWLIGHYMPSSEVGKFHLAMRFVLPLTFFLTAVNTALWPRAAGLKDPVAIISLAKRTLRLILLALIPLILYSILVPILVPVVFGSEYASIIGLTQLLCLRFCLSILINPIALISYSLGLIRLQCMINVFNLVVLTGVEIILLGKMGAYATVLARTITTATTVLILLPPAIMFYKKYNS
jgi:O-antigen/teichoic acid export membrane protein